MKRKVKDAWQALDNLPVVKKELTEANNALRIQAGEIEGLTGANGSLTDKLNRANQEIDNLRSKLQEKIAEIKKLKIIQPNKPSFIEAIKSYF